MPDHSLIKEKLEYIFDSNEDFFNSLKTSKNMDAYRNAFIQLKEEKKDIEHFRLCLDSLTKACTAAIKHMEKNQPVQQAPKKVNMKTGELMEFLKKQYGWGGNRERFKDRVEAAGMDKRKNEFFPEDVDRLIKYLRENYNRKKK